jgi:hypothetical protein
VPSKGLYSEEGTPVARALGSSGRAGHRNSLCARRLTRKDRTPVHIDAATATVSAAVTRTYSLLIVHLPPKSFRHEGRTTIDRGATVNAANRGSTGPRQ